MVNVYLDDQRKKPEGFVLAKNAEECFLLLKDCDINILSLDYDLGFNEQTGLDVVRYMIHHRFYPKKVYLHSSNLAARKKMYAMLNDSKPEHVEIFDCPYA